MIFQHEVDSVIEKYKNDMPLSSQDTIAIEHYRLGGFHPDVDQRDRRALKRWLNSTVPLPEQNAIPVPVHPPGQMELIV